MSTLISAFLIILTLITFCSAYNILAIVSMPLKSHYMAFKPLFRELAVRGHNVTVMNNFPDEEPLPNLNFVDLQGHLMPGRMGRGSHSMVSYENSGLFSTRLSSVIWNLMPMLKRSDCENLLFNENAKKHYKEGNKYDVIFVEQFISDCGLAYAAAFYDAPIIGITSHVLLPWSYPRLGIPFDVAADAFYFSYSGNNVPLFEKVEIFIENLFFNTISVWVQNRVIYDVFNDHVLDIERVSRERMKMMFAYQHFSLTGARILAPQVIEIGGVHIGTPKPVSKELEAFLSDAKHGAIYVSFGSNLKANTMSKNKLQQFLTAFKKMPYKVIWKWENSSLPAEYDNIYTSSWFPQLDVLCHPKVRAFVSHGGMLSISEAAHCGKPVLAIPFFGDQFSNSAAVRSVGRCFLIASMLRIWKRLSENLCLLRCKTTRRGYLDNGTIDLNPSWTAPSIGQST